MSDNNFEIKEDCFAYNPAKTLEKDRCNALINLFCKKEECRFYKKKKPCTKNKIDYQSNYYIFV